MRDDQATSDLILVVANSISPCLCKLDAWRAGSVAKLVLEKGFVASIVPPPEKERVVEVHIRHPKWEPNVSNNFRPFAHTIDNLKVQTRGIEHAQYMVAILRLHANAK